MRTECAFSKVGITVFGGFFTKILLLLLWSNLPWRFGIVVNVLVSINEVNLRWAQLVRGWVTVSGVQLLVQENLSQYITSHPGQLSLAIPPWVGAMNTSQRAVMPCGRRVKAVWFVIPLLSRAIYEHLWQWIYPIIGRYTSVRLLLVSLTLLEDRHILCVVLMIWYVTVTVKS